MKYRTKLTLAFVGISVACTGLAVGIGYVKTKSYLLTEIKSKAVSVAATTAATIDGNQIQSIAQISDESSPEYGVVLQELRRIRNNNRRPDIYVQYIYTLIRPESDRNEVVFQVDSDDEPSHVGDIFPDTEEDQLLDHWGEFYSSGKFTVDAWGESLTGYAPIYNKAGEVVAVVGVDLRSKDVLGAVNDLIIFGLWALCGAVALALLGAIFVSRSVTQSLLSLYGGMKEIGEGRLDHRIHLHTHDEFNELAVAMNEMAKGLQERERLKFSFARYVSSHVLDKILSSSTPLKLEGERKKLTFLFSDIRQFSKIAAELPPEEVVQILNEYFAVMLDIIFKHKGTLDKFLGDGIMVEFGAPLDDPNQEENALNAAIEMQRRLADLREKWKKEGKPAIRMGIGIHSGIAVVGNIGSERRMEYTAIGDPVNVASRLQELTKTLKTSILISEEAARPIKNKFPLKNFGPVALPDYPGTMTVYGIET